MRKTKIILVIVGLFILATVIFCVFITHTYATRNSNKAGTDEIYDTSYDFAVVMNDISDMTLDVRIRISSFNAIKLGMFGTIDRNAAVLNLSYKNNTCKVDIKKDGLDYEDDNISSTSFTLNLNSEERLYREAFFAEPDHISVNSYENAQDGLILYLISGTTDEDKRKELIYVAENDSNAILFVATLTINDKYHFPVRESERNYIAVDEFLVIE